MTEKSKIGWTNSTVNFWIGCHKVSAGCRNCYAETLSKRWKNNFAVLHRTTDVTFYSALKWKEGRRIFTCSLSDFFHKDADRWRADAWEVIQKTPQHTWQILTKRPERIQKCLPADWGKGYPNVWIGVSVEMPLYYNRIKELIKIPASVHFISCEPLLSSLNKMPLEDIEWVIVGGESGPHFRSMEENWVRDIMKQCKTEDIPFFYKQPAGIRNELPALLDGISIKEYPSKALEIYGKATL